MLEDTAWYKDEFDAHMSTERRKKKKEYASPEMLYDIDGEHSVKTIHEFSGKGYADTPGAATIDLHSKPKSTEDVVDDNSSEESGDLSNRSRYQLIAQLRMICDISESDKVATPHSIKRRVLTLISFSDESDSSQEATNSR